MSALKFTVISSFDLDKLQTTCFDSGDSAELPISPNNSTTISTLQNLILLLLEKSQGSSTAQSLASKVTALCQTRAALGHLARFLLFKRDAS